MENGVYVFVKDYGDDIKGIGIQCLSTKEFELIYKEFLIHAKNINGQIFEKNSTWVIFSDNYLSELKKTAEELLKKCETNLLFQTFFNQVNNVIQQLSIKVIFNENFMYPNHIKLAGKNSGIFNAIYFGLSKFICDECSINDISLKVKNKTTESVLIPVEFLNKMQEYGEKNKNRSPLFESYCDQVNAIQQAIKSQNYYFPSPSI